MWSLNQARCQPRYRISIRHSNINSPSHKNTSRWIYFHFSPELLSVVSAEERNDFSLSVCHHYHNSCEDLDTLGWQNLCPIGRSNLQSGEFPQIHPWYSSQPGWLQPTSRPPPGLFFWQFAVASPGPEIRVMQSGVKWHKETLSHNISQTGS